MFNAGLSVDYNGHAEAVGAQFGLDFFNSIRLYTNYSLKKKKEKIICETLTHLCAFIFKY